MKPCFEKTGASLGDAVMYDEIKSLFAQVNQAFLTTKVTPFPRGVLPYMGYVGMCRCEGYGFQAVYSRIGYMNQRVWV